MALTPVDDLEVRLNSWGQGLFAQIAFNAGEALCPLGGPLVPADDKPNFQVGADTWMGPSGTVTDQLNHGCNPNCAVMVEEPGYLVRAIRHINEGEELTIDYSLTSERPTHPSFDCQCGAINCRGRAGGSFDTIPGWQQERYLQLGLVPRYVLDSNLAAFT